MLHHILASLIRYYTGSNQKTTPKSYSNILLFYNQLSYIEKGSC